MQNQKYTATNTGRPFSFKAMIIGAKLKEDGYSDKEIREKSKNENIFQSRSEHQRIKTASTVNKRLNMLDEQLINKLINGDSTTIKQIIIYSIMKSDRFFFEFMDEVYKDKIILREFIIKDSDINIFIKRKQEQIPQIAQWTESTLKKLKAQYLTMLKEANFIKRINGAIEIIPPVIDPSLYNHLLEIGDETYIQAMLGEI